MIHYDFSTLDYLKSSINTKKKKREKDIRNLFETKLQIFVLICRINHGEEVDFMNGEQNICCFNTEHFVLA